jgi:hypothetical protein
VQAVPVAVGLGHAVVGEVLPAQALDRDARGGPDGEQIAVLAAGAGAWAADCRVSLRVTC